MPLLRYYITGHGLGHASRSCQVLQALTERHPAIRCEVVSDAAPWFLTANLPAGLPLRTDAFDIGVRQTDSLEMDLAATRSACLALQARAPRLIADEAADLQQAGVNLVVTDAAAIPCVAAAAARIPAVVISNFTWDWIYAGFTGTHPDFAQIAEWQQRGYRQTSLALRLPFCGELPIAVAHDLPLIARRSRSPRDAVRRRLGITTGERLGLLSFGGFGLAEAPLGGLARLPGWTFLGEAPLTTGNSGVRPLPADIPYPDLVNAADAVITKPGYGIVAECIAHHTPVLHTPRGDFREQPLLVAGLHRYGRAVEIDNARLRRGDLHAALEQLLALPHPTATLAANGAEVAADHLAQLLA